MKLPAIKSAPLSRLYWLTSVTAFQSAPSFFASVEYASQQGLGWLQYRDKAHHDLDLLKDLQQLCIEYGTQLMMNDHIELAAQLQCGVHLGKDDLPVAIARQQLPPGTLIGASCYQDLSRAIELQPLCDYVAFGAFYPSSTKPQAAIAPLTLLAQARQQLHCPIVAIGGITPQNVTPLLQAGADMMAVSAVLHDPAQFKKNLELFAHQFQVPL
jgi:thiamine-phosphate pyrophosphorylase